MEQHAVSTTAPMGLLEVLDVLDREADSLNQGGRHHEAEALWAAFRLLAKQAKPLRPEAVLPAKHSGKMLFFHSPSACFPVRRSGALEHSQYGSPPAQPVLGDSLPCVQKSCNLQVFPDMMQCGAYLVPRGL